MFLRTRSGARYFPFDLAVKLSNRSQELFAREADPTTPGEPIEVRTGQRIEDLLETAVLREVQEQAPCRGHREGSCARGAVTAIPGIL